MGGNVAKVAKDDLEKKLEKTVISSKNTLSYKYLESKNVNKKINKECNFNKIKRGWRSMVDAEKF